MHSVIIVEDELHILKHMEKMISSFDELQLKGAFLTPEEALAGFAAIYPDAVFLDIEMPRMNGIELAGKMLEHKHDLQIIFTTAYGQYALNAFEVEAIDYLMKPIMKEDIQRAVKRLNKAIKGKQPQKGPDKERSSFPVRCFGSFEVWDGQHQLVKWPTRRAEELFAYFLIREGEWVSKWELLDSFWPGMDEERGLHNLHNTLYRIKQVLKTLAHSPQIRKVNDGYLLEADTSLSDLGRMLALMKKEKTTGVLCVEQAVPLFFMYASPLFGPRDYIWSLRMQKHAAGEYRRLCSRLLHHYREQDQFPKGDEIIRHYLTQHVEDESMMDLWLGLVADWKGHEEKAGEYRDWFRQKVIEAGLDN